jgi:hypothetical protein
VPERIHWTRFGGVPLPKTARLITRVGKWGNPFPGCEHRTRDQAVDQYTAFLNSPTRAVDPAWLCPCDPEKQFNRARNYPTAQQIRDELRGWDLACACKPGERCHGNPLIDVANGGA